MNFALMMIHCSKLSFSFLVCLYSVFSEKLQGLIPQDYVQNESTKVMIYVRLLLL